MHCEYSAGRWSYIVPALLRLQSLLLHSHFQPLGFDTNSSPCFLSLLSPNTTTLIPLAPRPSVYTSAHLAVWARCAAQPGKTLGPCPRGEILVYEHLETVQIFSRGPSKMPRTINRCWTEYKAAEIEGRHYHNAFSFYESLHGTWANGPSSLRKWPSTRMTQYCTLPTGNRRGFTVSQSGLKHYTESQAGFSLLLSLTDGGTWERAISFRDSGKSMTGSHPPTWESLHEFIFLSPSMMLHWQTRMREEVCFQLGLLKNVFLNSL